MLWLRVEDSVPGVKEWDTPPTMNEDGSGA